jgi:PAS domain S-box-containing protein
MQVLVEKEFKTSFIDQVRYTSFLYASLLKSVAEDENISNQIALLDEMFSGKDIIFAEFIHPDATTIRPNYLSEAKIKFIEDFDIHSHGDYVYYVKLKLISDIDNRLLGTLRLGYDESSISERIAATYHYASFLAIAYIILSMLLVILFGHHLTKPISILRKVAKKIADGDQSVKLDISTNISEVDSLAKDLDNMRQKLVSQRYEVMNREKRLSAILDNAGEGIISINAHGIIQSFNKAAERIFGYTADKALGKNLSMLMPTPHREMHDNYIGNYLHTGKAKIIGTGRRLEAINKNGDIIPIFLNVSKVKQDEEVTFIGIIHDLSNEMAMESKLLQFWNAMEQSPVSVMITDPDGNLEYVNPFFCQVTGYAQEEVIGKSSNILKSGEIQKDVYAELWRTIKAGDIWRGVMQNRKKNGELFWESATICPVLDDNNVITHYIALKEDITDKRIKELMLTQAMKLEIVGRMTSGITHDFNNLLTIIIGNLQFLQEDVDKDNIEEKKELIADAMSAAHDGSNLIKQLLLFSRNQETSTQAVDTKSFLIKLHPLFSRIIPDSITMDVAVDDDVKPMMIDPHRLESAIINLIINSKDAMMPDGGKLRLFVKNLVTTSPEKVAGGQISPGNYVMISVTDSGSGMTDVVRKKALEPFFSTKTKTTGTGLGLSMVYDFINQSDGGLRIISDTQNGTTIDLILPAIGETPEFPQEESKDIFYELPKSKGEIVLVVEDREKVREFVCRALKRLGYQLLEAENSTSALESLQTNNKIDLMFSDISMPGEMNGLDLAEYISPRFPSLKILLTTGMESRLEEYRKMEITFPLLRKPYSIEKLAISIRSVLDNGQLTY